MTADSAPTQAPPLRVALVNMPFGAVDRPPIGLTQLAAVCRERFGGEVAVDLHYLNNDFARYLGAALYEDLASGPYYTTGLGDWLFRRTAFPGELDNTEEYRRRYFPTPRFHSSIASDRESFRAWMDQCQTDFADILERAIDEYGLDCYNVVGMTSAFSQNGACLALARLLKRRRGDLVTVMGGANCEGAMGEALARNAPHLDFVFSGTSLVSFPNFLHELRERRAPAARVVTGPERPINTPPPDLDYDSFLDAFDHSVRGLGLEPTLLFETSRGCWWGEISQCTFCGLNGLTMSYREMEADHAVRTMQRLFRYRPRSRSLMSVDNIMPRGFVREVVPRLKTPPDVAIFYEVKANLSRSDLRTLAGGGFRELQPGIESLSTGHLRLMRKGTTSFRNVRLLENCGEFGIDVLWNLLVGFPHEDEQPYEHYHSVLPRLFHLQPPSGIYPLRFDRFSPYFENAEEYGLKLTPAQFYRLIYPYTEEALDDLAYYFVDTALDPAYRTHLVKWLRPLREIVTNWQRSWEGGARPELKACRDAGQIRVLDTRAGEHSYLLSDAQTAALRACRTPARPSIVQAAADLGALPAEQVLDDLRERGLVFEDVGKAMSLLRLPS